MHSARDIAHEVQEALDARDIAVVALGSVQFRLLQTRSSIDYVSPTFAFIRLGPSDLPLWAVGPVCNGPE